MGRTNLQGHAALRFKVTDAGKALSKRKGDRLDCTVRTLATLCDLPYDTVYDLLGTHGRKWGQGFDLEQWFRHGARGLAKALASVNTPRTHIGLSRDAAKRRSGSVHGGGPIPTTLTPEADRWLFRQVSFPALLGRPRVTLEGGLGAVCKQGRWAVCVGRHVFAVKDGVIHDDKLDGRHRKDRCLYSIWACLPVSPWDTLWLVTLERTYKALIEGRHTLKPGRGRFRKRLGVVAARDRVGAYEEACRVFEHLVPHNRADLVVAPLDE